MFKIRRLCHARGIASGSATQSTQVRTVPDDLGREDRTREREIGNRGEGFKARGGENQVRVTVQLREDESNVQVGLEFREGKDAR